MVLDLRPVETHYTIRVAEWIAALIINILTGYDYHLVTDLEIQATPIDKGERSRWIRVRAKLSLATDFECMIRYTMALKESQLDYNQMVRVWVKDWYGDIGTIMAYACFFFDHDKETDVLDPGVLPTLSVEKRTLIGLCETRCPPRLQPCRDMVLIDPEGFSSLTLDNPPIHIAALTRGEIIEIGKTSPYAE